MPVILNSNAHAVEASSEEVRIASLLVSIAAQWARVTHQALVRQAESQYRRDRPLPSGSSVPH
ncbi:hypothetical protein [Streptomyces chilikensis]|uniref:hypothetical protein n=1 Tax=Streptomyces chilikensis TaxID=1194079 RepID=UPI00140CD544|nr:hypothetical protein [Streptomyces chilikensis]